MNDLRGNTEEPTDDGRSLVGRIVGIAFVVAVLVVAGTYVYETWPTQPPKSVVADNRLPPSTP